MISEALDDRHDAMEVASISGTAQEPSHGDAPLTAPAVRAILAASLGVEVRELRGLSARGARAALNRLNELVQRLSENAATDELTGVLRRGAGYTAAYGEIDRARRGGGRLVLAMVDLDGLKQVNDSRGHLAGDDVLRAVAHTLQEGLRSYDVVIRFGGDEFLCILGGVSRGQAEARFEALGHDLDLQMPGQTISVGMSELGEHDRLDDLISRADAELYARRRRRRGSGPAA